MNIRKFKWILAFAGAVVVVLLLRGFAFTSCFIPSTGMENSIFQGERILVNKWSYGLRVPFMSLFSYHRWCESPVRRQDIVVFNNPAGIRQPVIDRREIYISRCLGVPGDTLLVDSLFSVISPEAQFNPDKKRLYSYPASKENLITSLMHTLSITNDGLMGSNDSTHVRSFSRYEYYLLEQAISDQNWIQPLTEKSETGNEWEREFCPTFVKQGRCRTESADCSRKREIYPGLSLEHDLAAEYPRDARRQTGRNKERHSLRGRKTHTTLLFHQRLLLDGV